MEHFTREEAVALAQKTYHLPLELFSDSNIDRIHTLVNAAAEAAIAKIQGEPVARVDVFTNRSGKREQTVAVFGDVNEGDLLYLAPQSAQQTEYDKLLGMSQDNYVAQFGSDAASNWIYDDLRELLADAAPQSAQQNKDLEERSPEYWASKFPVPLGYKLVKDSDAPIGNQDFIQIPVEYQYLYPDGSWRCSNGDEVNGSRPMASRALYARKDGK